MPSLKEGQKFERYQVLHELGRSISGITYKADDTLLQRRVALKLLNPQATSSDAARRQFFRDMQRISTISHPMLTATLDYGDSDGQLYVVRRAVDYGSLLGTEGRLWFQTPFDLRSAFTYGFQLAQVLGHAHRYGQIHGSLTLSNLLITHDLTHEAAPYRSPFLLADPGIAHIVRSHQKQSGLQLPFTASPEQLQGRATAASDQYALAALLYFWLAGRPPFLGSPAEIAHLKLTQSIPTLGTYQPEFTLEQEGILRRALSVYPEERYPTILTFAETLLATLANRPARTPATRSPEIGDQPITISQKTPDSSISDSSIEERKQDEPDTEDLPGIVMPNENTLPVPTNDPDVPMQEGSTQKQTDEDDVIISVSATQEDETMPNEQALEEVFIQKEETETLLQQVAKQQSRLDHLLNFLLHPETAHNDQQEPMQPEPTPQVEPDVPQPDPHPEPIPAPLPDPIPAPEEPTEPEPATEPLPTEPPTIPPAPDIPQPLPDPITPTFLLQEGPTTDEVERVSLYEARQSAQHASLVIRSSQRNEALTVPLVQAETTLGRAGSSDILLEGELVSRHHALIRHEGELFLIYDLRSTHGVTVNEEKLPTEIGYPLEDGDKIDIGEYNITFHLEEDPLQAAPLSSLISTEVS